MNGEKKWLRMLLAMIAGASMLTGCREEDTPADGVSEAVSAEADKPEQQPEKEAKILQVAVFEGGYGAKMWTEIKAAFEALVDGVTVELTVDKKIADVISSGIKDGVYPDVVHCATGREAGLTETITKEKGLLPLTGVLDMIIPGEAVTVEDKIISGFLDTVGTNPYNDDVTYYAPMFYSPCGLFYNAGLLEEKGWTLPATWDEMWALGDKARAEGISLFTYPTAGYFDAFLFALMESAGGASLYNKAMTYEDGIWESDQMQEVTAVIAKLTEYTEATTVANANDDSFTKNQQLILDNKAIFCPNGTWLPGEMKDVPRADGFKWGFTAIPAVSADQYPSSFTFFEQMWIPAAAENQGLAEQFVAFMYSDKAAEIFAKFGAAQPIEGVSSKLSEENQMYYNIYENDTASVVLGGFVATAPVEGVTMSTALFDSINRIFSGNKTVDEWMSEVEKTSDRLRAALEY